MSHLLAKMLCSDGRFFDQMIADLERATGDKCYDVELAGRTVTETNQKLRDLNLAPADTLLEELKQALLAKYAIDNQNIYDQLFGDNNPEVETIIDFLNRLKLPNYLGLTDRFIIEILTQNKPVNFLRKLKFESIDQAFSQFDFDLILLICFKTESSAWQDRVRNYLFTNLKRGYMEEKSIKFKIVDSAFLSPEIEELFETNQLINTIFVNPDQFDTNNILNTLILAVQTIQRKVDLTNKMKLFRVNNQFEISFRHWYQPSSSYVWRLANNPMPWRSINRNFAKNSSLLNQKFNQICSERLIDFDPYQKLIDGFDGLEFWQKTESLAYLEQNQSFSFNLFDVAKIFQDQNSQEIEYFEQALWEKLTNYYLSNANLANNLIYQLQNRLIKEKNEISNC